MYPPRADLEWKRLHAFCLRARAMLAWTEQRLLAPADSVSRWSAAKHLFHVALSNELGLRNVQALLRDQGRLIKEFEELSELGQGVLRTGRYPRGVAQAPRMVTPPERLDLSILEQLVESNLADLDALQPDLERAQAIEACISHQQLGDLRPREWLRFMRAHSWHHALIIRDIVRARG